MAGRVLCLSIYLLIEMILWEVLLIFQMVDGVDYLALHCHVRTMLNICHIMEAIVTALTFTNKGSGIKSANVRQGVLLCLFKLY